MKHIFLHIPKNGGTTLQKIVDDQYKRHQIYNILDHEREERLRELEKKSSFKKKLIKVVKGGHFPYGCHRYFKDPSQVKYFAMLRNPANRALSYYSYVQRTPLHYLHDRFSEEQITFDKFLERDDLNLEICNGQTKLIAGLRQRESCTEEHFENAKAHLEESFFLVGIMERYLETLYLLKKRLNWTRPINYKVLNVDKEQKTQLTPAQHEKILELNRFDNAIYEEALKNFDEAFSKVPKSEFEKFKLNLQA